MRTLKLISITALICGLVEISAANSSANTVRVHNELPDGVLVILQIVDTSGNPISTMSCNNPATQTIASSTTNANIKALLSSKGCLDVHVGANGLDDLKWGAVGGSHISIAAVIRQPKRGGNATAYIYDSKYNDSAKTGVKGDYDMCVDQLNNQLGNSVSGGKAGIWLENISNYGKTGPWNWKVKCGYY